MTTWSLGAEMIAPVVVEMVSKIEADPLFNRCKDPSISREAAIAAITAVLWAYETRQGSTSGGYAWLAVCESLGIDLRASKIAFLPREQSEPTP